MVFLKYRLDSLTLSLKDPTGFPLIYFSSMACRTTFSYLFILITFHFPFASQCSRCDPLILSPLHVLFPQLEMSAYHCPPALLSGSVPFFSNSFNITLLKALLEHLI